MRYLTVTVFILVICFSCKMIHASSSGSSVGRWKAVDFVRNKSDFKPGHKSFKGELRLKDFVFKKDGTTHMQFWSWKDDKLFQSKEKIEAKFYIEEIDYKDYLFLEWMSGDTTTRTQKPWLYVFEKDKTYNFLNTKEYGNSVIEMEKEFLSRLKGKTNKLNEREYILRYQFPEDKQKEHLIKLQMSEFRGDILNLYLYEKGIIKTRSANFWRKNNAVYWLMGLPKEKYYPSFDFVGIIDGDKIWGHIYRISNDAGGWHETTFNVGVFSITPATEKELQVIRSKIKKIKINPDLTIILTKEEYEEYEKLWSDLSQKFISGKKEDYHYFTKHYERKIKNLGSKELSYYIKKFDKKHLTDREADLIKYIVQSSKNLPHSFALSEWKHQDGLNESYQKVIFAILYKEWRYGKLYFNTIDHELFPLLANKSKLDISIYMKQKMPVRVCDVIYNRMVGLLLLWKKYKIIKSSDTAFAENDKRIAEFKKYYEENKMKIMNAY